MELLQHGVDGHLRELVLPIFNEQFLLYVLYDIHLPPARHRGTHAVLAERGLDGRRHLAPGPSLSDLGRCGIAGVPLRSHFLADSFVLYLKNGCLCRTTD